jgi:hypothetical protein
VSSKRVQYRPPADILLRESAIRLVAAQAAGLRRILQPEALPKLRGCSAVLSIVARERRQAKEEQCKHNTNRCNLFPLNEIAPKYGPLLKIPPSLSNVPT